MMKNSTSKSNAKTGSTGLSKEKVIKILLPILFSSLVGYVSYKVDEHFVFVDINTLEEKYEPSSVW